MCDFVQTTFGATVEFGPNSVALIRRTPFTEEKELKTTLNRLKFDEKDLKTTQNRLKQPQTSPDGYKSLAKQLWTQRHTLWDLSQTALDESSAAAEMTKVVSSLAPQKLCKAPPSVSGCSLGLPNATTGAPFFHDDNFSRLLSGETFLQRLSAAELETLLRRRFFSVEKDSTGARAKRVLKSENELFRLVARLGRFDLVREFGVPQVYLDGCDRTTELAIGAGLKALQSAGIKLCRTAEHPLALPKDMREDTGVIFASSFGSAGSLVRAAAAYASFSAQNKNNSVFSVGKNKENAVLAKNNSKNSNNSVLSVENNPENVFSAGNNPTPNAAPEPTPYEFDRKLLLKLLIPANAQLAQLTGAAGPNTTINGACASTAQAIALASDWLALGRCRRVLVVAADNVTDPELLPLIGGSFLSLGACSTASEPNCAAVPFDARRSGMVLGMGAVGLLLETSAALSRRGGAPLAQLVASQVGNAASHGSRLDRVHLACEMRRFVAAAARRLGLSVGALARGTLYFAHETGTVGDGGCARAEVEALRAAFGAHMAEVTVCAIKGGLGHAMGANLEDAVAVWSLAKGYAPPVAFSAEAEEGLRPLRLWRGGVHGKRFALRMSAGFGGQVAFLLYRKQESSDKCALI